MAAGHGKLIDCQVAGLRQDADKLEKTQRRRNSGSSLTAAISQNVLLSINQVPEAAAADCRRVNFLLNTPTWRRCE